MPKRILVAEDDASSLMILKCIIEAEAGNEVISATDGEAAWVALMGGSAFDACILDVMMPLLDGLELTKRIRAHPDVKGLPVVLCTAQADRSTVGRAAALSISAYLIKPYASDRVLKQLRGLGEGRAASAKIEPFELAARRLGIPERQLTDSLKDMVKEAAAIAGVLREAGVASDGVAALARMGAVRDTARNLGAFAMVRALSVLEESIRSGAVPANGEGVRSLVEESRRLVMALAANAHATAGSPPVDAVSPVLAQ